MIVSPIQDFPYGLLLNSTVEPYGQQPISFAPDIQAFRPKPGNWLHSTLLRTSLFFQIPFPHLDAVR